MAKLKTIFNWVQKCCLCIFGTILSVTGVYEDTAPLINNIELAIGSTNLLSLEDGSSATVDFIYAAGHNPNITASLDTNLCFPVFVDTENKEGFVFIHSRLLRNASLDFGTYLLTLVLQDDGRNYTKEMVIFYEEPIEGFKVTTNKIVHYPNEEIDFDVTFIRGTNVEIEWFFDQDSTSCLCEYFGKVRQVQQGFYYTDPGFYNVSVIAVNSITRTYVSVPITVRRRNTLTFMDRLVNAKTKARKESQPSFQAVIVNPKTVLKLE